MPLLCKLFTCLDYTQAPQPGTHAIWRATKIKADQRSRKPCVIPINQFNLADDLIEPFRPVIDRLVHSMNLQPDEEMSPQLKHSIFNVANLVIALDNKKFRVYSAIGRSVMSFSQSVEANANKIELPSLLPLEEYRYA